MKHYKTDRNEKRNTGLKLPEKDVADAGVHYSEPSSSIQALRVNPFCNSDEKLFIEIVQV